MVSFWQALLHLDPAAMVAAGGYGGVMLLIFAESGLLIGIFLPGDSLLFAAGLLASGKLLSYPLLATLVVIAAILGDTVGYWIGAKAGEAFFSRPDSWLFKHEYLVRTETFYEKHGTRAVVLARFVPIFRTIAPVLAGAGSMRYRRFLAYNALGALLWGAGIVSFGYFLGKAVPGLAHYLLPISLVVIVLSFIPIALHLWSARAQN